MIPLKEYCFSHSYLFNMDIESCDYYSAKLCSSLNNIIIYIVMYNVVSYLHVCVYINYKDLIIYMKTLHSLVNTLLCLRIGMHTGERI